MEKKGLMQKYREVIEFSGLKLKAEMMIGIMLVALIAAFVIASFFNIVLAILVTLLVVDIFVGLPFYLADKKIAQIEKALPDVLHHMSTTLKTGGTIEVALREASRINYGPITEGLKDMLRIVNEGKTFENAFKDFAEQSRSELLKKAAIVIIAARRSGGGLLETLNAMSEDIRALSRLKRERKTKTFMQFLFIIVAGCIIAPLVFAIVKSVLEILIKVGTSTITAEGAALVANYDLMFQSYIIIESAFTILAAVQVREGSWSKSVVYIPIGVFIAYLIYIIISATFLPTLGG